MCRRTCTANVCARSNHERIWPSGTLARRCQVFQEGRCDEAGNDIPFCADWSALAVQEQCCRFEFVTCSSCDAPLRSCPPSLHLTGLAHCAKDDLSNLSCQERGNGVANLDVLRGPWPFKEVVVRECLEAGSFPHRQTPALSRVGMDIVMPVFGNVSRYRRCRAHPRLYAEAV